MREPRTAIVTGGNRGLGLETARQLAGQGYRVLVTSRDAGAGEAAVEPIRRAGGDVHVVALDVAGEAGIRRLRDLVVQRFGTAHVLVNNAGVYLDEDASALTVEPAILQATLATNLVGPWLLCQAFVPLMVEQNFGRVVNVSSGMGQMDDMNDDGASYRVSKLALNGLTRIVADRVRGRNVLVNAVCPGCVRTDMGGPGATRTVELGAQGIVWAATLPDGGPTGGFFRDGRPIDW